MDNVQREIVLSEEDSTMVIAGAGSGKSLTILGRIMYLVSKGVDTSEILCVSFTNAASDNLKKNLMKNNIKLDVMTFHKLGLQILKDNGFSINMVEKEVIHNIVDCCLKEEPNLKVMLPNLEFNINDEDMEGLQNQIILNSDWINNIKKLLFTFINLFKSNNFNLDNFEDFICQNSREKDRYTRDKNNVFLKLSAKIYEEYTYYLNKNSQIDFHDMIKKATEVVLKKGCRGYKYIIVDEYQDVSLIKCELIKSIYNYTNSKLLVVGDDFQSIYRFTGSNLKVFTDFEDYFPYTKVFKLEKTYRNSNELLNVMGKFILKNPGQIYKQLISEKHDLKPINIYYYDKDIYEVWDKVMDDLKGKEFMILGRNNKDGLSFKKFMTVHKSKGLEFDNVVIINLEDKITGFPNKIVNDDVLKYVTTDDFYPYEEERRLFYVALTRTKNKNYLLVNKNNPSMFITELLNDSFKYVNVVNKVVYCPKCGKALCFRKENNSLFYTCSSYPRCDYTRDIS